MRSKVKIDADEAIKRKGEFGGSEEESLKQILEKQDDRFTDIRSLEFGWVDQHPEEGVKSDFKLMSMLPNGKVCHHKDTLILMSNFSWKKIKDVNIGDYVIGVHERKTKSKTYMYFDITEVTDKGRRYSNCVKLSTEKGNTICTPDHRWLTYPLEYIETDQLKTNGTTKFHNSLRCISNPVDFKKDKEFKRGWLAGIFDGDGTIKLYTYKRKSNNKNHRYFRTALSSTDTEIIKRAKTYIEDIYNESWKISKRKKENPNHSQSWIIKNYSCNSYKKLKALAYDFNMNAVSTNFIRGYLGGIFDAEGSYDDDGHITIACKTDKRVRDRTKYFLSVLGYQYEDAIAGNARVVRVKGGIPDHIRFFAETNPVLQRKKDSILGKRINGKRWGSARIIEKRNLPKDIVYSLTTTTHNYVADGFISHNCFPDRSENVENIIPEDPYICLVYEREREAFAKILFPEYQPKIYIPPSRIPAMVWRDKGGKVRRKLPHGDSYENRIMQAIKEMEGLGFDSIKIIFRKNKIE